MINVVAYIRVSTADQARYGSGFDGQRLQINVYAKIRELMVRKWFTDDASARNEEEGSERPGFKEACAYALKRGWPIIVADASRFSRTEETYERFIAAGGKVYDTQTGFGADDAVMAGRIARAKFDGDRRAKATGEGRARAKAAGVKFGTPAPQNGAKVSAEARGKQAAIRKRELERIRDQAAKSGVVGASDLADWLNRNGHPTALGAPWTAKNVRRVLGGAGGLNVVSEPPIDFEGAATVQEHEKVSLTSDEQELLRKMIPRMPWDEKKRTAWLERIEQPMTRSSRKTLMEKARATLERAEARKLVEERGPDWGRF